MDNIILVAFITGLTAGGLSCFAVQGGLLTGSIAQQVESTSQSSGKTASSSKKKKNNGRRIQPANPKRPAGMIQPILLFTTAKLVAYTILGFFLGLLGSLFSFSSSLKGAIQLAIGIFLVGNALRMLNVHPIFRYFSFEPPSQLTRYIRRVSKRAESWATPLFLGALTLLIPCGVTQSMMAVAVGTGNPLTGAVIMFAFILGTSPTFIGVSWLVTSLGGMFQKYFYRFVALTVLVLGLYAINGGLVLVDSPVSSAKILRAFNSDPPVSVTATTVAPSPAAPASSVSAELAPGSPLTASDTPPSDVNRVVAPPPPTAAVIAQINVENSGYLPDNLALPANLPIELHLITNHTRSCSRAFVIPELGVQELLPATGEKVIQIPAQKAGKTIDFMCSMGMYTGVFQFK